MDDRIHALVQKVWDYHHLDHRLAHADAILVLCSHDKAVAARGAELLLQGWAPILIFAGGLEAITRRLWHEPEADQFADIAIDIGVPTDRTLVENRSTNTGQTSSSRNGCSPRKGSILRHLSWCRNRTWNAGAMRRSGRCGRKKNCS